MFSDPNHQSQTTPPITSLHLANYPNLYRENMSGQGSRSNLSQGTWRTRDDGSIVFDASRPGPDLGVHNAVLRPGPRPSSTIPTSDGPPSPTSADGRLPLNVPRSSDGVPEIYPGSRFSSSSSDQTGGGWPPQVNPRSAFGDFRPQQPGPGSSPPVPQSLRDLQSSPYQHDPRRPPSQASRGSDSDRPFSPTPTQRAAALNQINTYSHYLFASERSTASDPNTSDRVLTTIGNDVRQRAHLASQRLRSNAPSAPSGYSRQ